MNSSSMLGYAHLLLIGALVAVTNAARLSNSDTPVARVIKLLNDLNSQLTIDGQKEQASWDKYACWCEDVFKRKTKDISEAQDEIEMLTSEILKLTAATSSLAPAIAQLKKDIAENEESRMQTIEVRKKESQEYAMEKMEAEESIQALQAAIIVLTGAGQKKSFLGAVQETQLLNVMDGVRGVIRQQSVTDSVSDEDLEVVKHFLSKPEDFVGEDSGFMSAAQVSQNPLGDYSQQSGQIQGILKQMLDTFSANLEKSKEEDSEKQTNFEGLISVKTRELEGLQSTLQVKEAEYAQKTKELADFKLNRDETSAQLKADQTFYATTKGNCQAKAIEFSARHKLRTEELLGINKAIDILSHPTAQATFQNVSVASLLQTSSVVQHHDAKGIAVQHLRELGAKLQSARLMSLSLELGSGGHFHQVIAMIDRMLELLRKEERDDVAHRDRCQASLAKNEKAIEDLNNHIGQADSEIERIQLEQNKLTENIATLNEAIAATGKTVGETQQMRNIEHDEYLRATKEERDAEALVQSAVEAITSFYTSNGIPLQLLQKRQAPSLAAFGEELTKIAIEQNSAEAEPPAPETTWVDEKYSGAQPETGTVISLLKTLKDDITKSIQTLREQDASDQAEFEKQMDALKEMMEAQKSSKVEAEVQLAAEQAAMADTQEFKVQKGAELANEQQTASTLARDCDWVQTSFESRREKRKAEMNGLIEAKDYLAGTAAEEE